uniref:Uncharacterized protein n=1 Tax=Meloidogyne enterolobii TaxID=390850 RepID=A0A6V7UEC7_MELEN|nr:unnamed protein product [Meloidogyne enterolobii]
MREGYKKLDQVKNHRKISKLSGGLVVSVGDSLILMWLGLHPGLGKLKCNILVFVIQMIFMLALIYLVNIKMPTYTKMTQMPITITGSFISNKVLNNFVYKIMVNFGYTDTNKSGYKQIQIDMVMNRVGVFESSQPSSQFFSGLIFIKPGTKPSFV